MHLTFCTHTGKPDLKYTSQELYDFHYKFYRDNGRAPTLEDLIKDLKKLKLIKGSGDENN